MRLSKPHTLKSNFIKDLNAIDILVIMMGLFSLLPMIGSWYYIRVALPSLLLAFELIRRKHFSVRMDILLFFLLWGISLFGSQLIIVGVQTSANNLAFRKEIFRLIIYLVIALSVQKYDISFRILTKITFIMFFFHFTIQVFQFLKYDIVFDFIINNYMDGLSSFRHLGLAYNDSLLNFRSGSIFINPNIYVPYAMFFLVVFIQNVLISKTAIEKIFFLVMSLLSIISIVFSGSRTGFVGMMIIMILYIFKEKRISVPFKIISLIIVIFSLYYSIQNSDARLLQVNSGLDDSFGAKINAILQYVYNINPISFIMGNNVNIGSTQWHYDFEWGYIFVYYGFLGLSFYTMLHRMIIKRIKSCQKNMSELVFLNQGLLILFIVESMSATVFMNVPVFYFLSIVFFAKEIIP